MNTNRPSEVIGRAVHHCNVEELHLRRTHDLNQVVRPSEDTPAQTIHRRWSTWWIWHQISYWFVCAHIEMLTHDVHSLLTIYLLQFSSSPNTGVYCEVSQGWVWCIEDVMKRDIFAKIVLESIVDAPLTPTHMPIFREHDAERYIQLASVHCDKRIPIEVWSCPTALIISQNFYHYIISIGILCTSQISYACGTVTMKIGQTEELFTFKCEQTVGGSRSGTYRPHEMSNLVTVVFILWS